MVNQLSIIIPTYNEEKLISQLLWHLKTQSATNNIKEIIIVDGGSNDKTKDIISKFIMSNNSEESELNRDVGNKVLDTIPIAIGITRTDIKLLNSEKGRAKQMNLGAKHAKGDILYFLHADTFPPNAYDKLIFQEVEKNNLAGCFKMRFNNSHWWLQLAGWLTKFNWRACRGGDQSLFISKHLFNELNGFDEQFTIYEDIDLINKLYEKNQFTIIQHWVTTSARRYQDNGIWKLQYHFWAIYIKKWFGASAQDLQQYYTKHIL